MALKRPLENNEQGVGKRSAVGGAPGEKSWGAAGDQGLEPVEARTVRIRGLPRSASDADVEKFFKGLRVLSVFAVPEGRKGGEAYVEFDNSDAVEVAKKRHKGLLGSRYIEVYRVTNADELHSARQRGVALKDLEGWGENIVDDSNLVRMRGLPWDASDERVREFFVGLRVASGGVTFVTAEGGRSTGEAFVRFETPEDLKGARSFHQRHMGHRYVEVFTSSQSEMDETLRKPARNIILTLNDAKYLVKLRGIPFTSTEKDIRDFFHPLRCERVYLLNEPSGRASGETLVEFSDEKALNEALKYDRKSLGHRYIELFPCKNTELFERMRYGVRNMPGIRAPEDYVAGSDVSSESSSHPSPRRRAGRDDHDDRRGGYDRRGGGGYDDGYGFEQPESACLRARGLPWDCTEEQLAQFFQGANVTPTRIHLKRDGGEAFVEFLTEADAAKAMNRHKEYIGSRYVELFRISYDEMADIIGLPVRYDYPPRRRGPPPPRRRSSRPDPYSREPPPPRARGRYDDYDWRDSPSGGPPPPHPSRSTPPPHSGRTPPPPRPIITSSIPAPAAAPPYNPYGSSYGPPAAALPAPPPRSYNPYGPPW